MLLAQEAKSPVAITILLLMGTRNVCAYDEQCEQIYREVNTKSMYRERERPQ